MDGNVQIRDMTGLQCGRLRVLKYNGRYGKTKQAGWLCICECGKETVASGNQLRKGHKKSCGCLRAGPPLKHGRTDSPLYAVWMAMHDRCRNPNNQSYRRYGARGIRVCDRWKEFSLFLEDMGERPDGMTIERNDNDGDYCPENCRWANRKEQANNTRRNRFIETSIGRLTLKEACKIAGITQEAMYQRRKSGRTGDSLIEPRRQGRAASTT